MPFQSLNGRNTLSTFILKPKGVWKLWRQFVAAFTAPVRSSHSVCHADIAWEHWCCSAKRTNVKQNEQSFLSHLSPLFQSSGLCVNDVEFPLPTLVFCSAGFPTEVYVHPSSSAALPCSFHLPDNDEVLSVTWSFNGSVVAYNNQTESQEYWTTSANGSHGFFPLRLFNVSPRNRGVYECHVKSNLTSYSSNVTLIVLGKFKITARTSLRWPCKTTIRKGMHFILSCYTPSAFLIPALLPLQLRQPSQCLHLWWCWGERAQ